MAKMNAQHSLHPWMIAVAIVGALLVLGLWANSWGSEPSTQVHCVESVGGITLVHDDHDHYFSRLCEQWIVTSKDGQGAVVGGRKDGSQWHSRISR